MCLFKNVDTSHINSIRVRRLSPTHQERKTMTNNKDTPKPTKADMFKIALDDNAVYQELEEFNHTYIYDKLK